MITFSSRRIGRFGVVARVVVGMALLALTIVGLPPVGRLLDWRQLALGLIALPAVTVAVQLLRLAFTQEPLGETSGLATCVNCAVLVVLLLAGATRDVTLVFLGASLLVAAVRRDGGCETLAISNWLLGRDDQVGCLIFSPLDALEARPARLSTRA